MPRYTLTYRKYGWPIYAEPGKGEQVSETLEADDDKSAKRKVEQRKDFKTFQSLNHEGCRDAEYDYNGDFALSHEIDLKPPKPARPMTDYGRRTEPNW